MLLDTVDGRDDTALLAQIASGDEQAFSTVFHRYRGPVYRFVRQMSGSSSTAEDVTQEVFIALMETRDRFDASKGSLKVYLYGIARNLLRRHMRRQSMQREVDMDHLTDAVMSAAGHAANALADLEQAEAVALLRRAIVALPPHYREVIVLCELHEMSYEDAALIVDCPLGTIRSRLSRARRVLARKCRLDAGVSAQDETSCPPRRCLA